MKKIVLALLATIAVIFCGCSGPPKTAALVIAVDETVSAQRARDEGVKVAKATASVMLDNREGIDCRMIAFGRQVRTLMDSRITEEETILKRFDNIQGVPSPTERGTYWGDMIGELARQVDRSPAERLSLMIISDGEVHDLRDPATNRALVAQIKSLAANPKIQTIIVGPLTSYGAARENWRDTVEQLFEPFDANHRLIVYGPDDTPTAIARMKELQGQ